MQGNDWGGSEPRCPPIVSSSSNTKATRKVRVCGGVRVEGTRTLLGQGRAGQGKGKAEVHMTGPLGAKELSRNVLQ